MLVSELIEQLQKLDPDKRILVEGYEDGFDDPREIIKVKVRSRVESKYYSGDYEDISESEESDNDLDFDAYVIPGKPRRG